MADDAQHSAFSLSPSDELNDLRMSAKATPLYEHVKRFIRETVEPMNAEWDRLAEGHKERWTFAPGQLEVLEVAKNKAKSEGLWNFFLPDAETGDGLSNLDYAYIAVELGKVPLASETMNCSAPDTGNMEVLERVGTPEQKEKWLKPLLNGEIRSAYVMTEPNVASSDAKNISTRAELVGEEWVINGAKTFITNAGTDISDGLIVLARTGEDAKGRPALSTFIVPRDTPGLVIGNRLKKFGWKSMDTRELFFENCRIPAANILGQEGKGLRHTLTGMDLGRIVFATGSLGIAQACLDHSVAYAKERVQFGQPIGSFQAIQFRLADLAARIFCCRQAIYAAAKKRDLGLECEVEASMAKLISCRLGVEAADTAFHVFGGYGFSLEYPVAKLYADAKIMEIGEGTNEMQLMRIAKGLGL